MKAIYASFKQYLRFIKRDKMLLVICFMPIVCGFIFRYGIPFLNLQLIKYLSLDLSAYYSLVDIFYGIVNATMFCIVSALVILEERDDHLINSLFVTPLGKNGYLVSRLGIPALLSFIITLILFPIFHLTSFSLGMAFVFICAGTLQGTIISLLVVSLSSHKLEGMAVAKMASLESMVILVPFFVKDATSYLLSWIPSFWIGKALILNQSFFLLVAIVISMIWILGLVTFFQKKIA